MHGRIFKENIISLEVSASNKCPDLIACYYLKAAKNVNVIPKIIKADYRTKHSVIELIHLFWEIYQIRSNSFRSSHCLWIKEYNPIGQMFGQKWLLETFYSRLGRSWIIWLIHRDSSDPVQVDSLRFCFTELLRGEVTDVATAWNQHIISHLRNGGPMGQPDVMFLWPHIYDTKDHLQYDSDEGIDEFHCVIGQLLDGFSDDFREFPFYFIDQEGFEMPTSRSGCLDYTFSLLKKKIVEHT